jgi:hypothetical protein
MQRVNLETKLHFRAVEVYLGAVEVHPLTVEDHPGAIEAHYESPIVHLWAVECQS